MKGSGPLVLQTGFSCLLLVRWSVDVSREGGVSPKIELLAKIPERARQLFPSLPVGGADEAFQSLLRLLGPEAALESVIMAVGLSRDTRVSGLVQFTAAALHPGNASISKATEVTPRWGQKAFDWLTEAVREGERRRKQELRSRVTVSPEASASAAGSGDDDVGKRPRATRLDSSAGPKTRDDVAVPVF
ncbi:Centromere protein P [Liparis tanakae]|uniref:Centromere protein P n=1 Tax=Liparis tanakae TaxID=230148 RepID=A0A4Z2H518_9TELE|nr:Centromere protein P [Liparis tanakae]